jgi:broad specificity phosphatase PhoE
MADARVDVCTTVCFTHFYCHYLKEDHLRVLTPLGRKQAHLTGQRLAEMVKGCSSGDGFTPCNVKVVRVSNLARAKETADIIAQYLPGAEQAEPDQELNEGRYVYSIRRICSARMIPF